MRVPPLYSDVRLRSGAVESLMLIDDSRPDWTPSAGTFGVLVERHDGDLYEVELFDPEGDYRAVALATVRATDFEVEREANT